jgi:16S rRNA (guanine(527)-N(7))-methyltransferase RsmG
VPYLDLIESEFDIFKIELDASQKQALARYCEELARWNQKINLTGLAGAALVRRLVAEPVWIAHELELAGSLIDIGSGNGSPAVPFRITRPFRSCELIESRLKRAGFLRQLASTLKLSNVKIHCARFEDIVSDLEQPDWISLQAVALNRRLFEAIRVIAGSTTKIVWITSLQASTEVAPERTLKVPNTGTQVFVFRLDLP